MTSRILLPLAALLLGLVLPAAHAERIKDLAQLYGVRDNQLIGYGLVVGLDGSGDQTTQTPFTVQSLSNMLSQLGINVDPAQATRLQLKNVAAVMVTASLPAFAKPGQQIDVTVASMGNAKSIKGGTLLMTPLKGVDGQIYAVAQGSVVVAGAGASAGGSSVTVNHLSAGRIPAGALVERTVASNSMGEADSVTFELRQADFTTANRVEMAINRFLGDGTASALDARMVRVKAPREHNRRIAFLAQVENLNITPGELPAKIILNARTGSIVMNQAVQVETCAVAHGNLSVTITTTPQVSQPGALSGGQTVTTQKSDISIKSEGGQVVVLPSGTQLNEVVKALNAVGASPQDLLAILQAMKSAGALRAELEII